VVALQALTEFAGLIYSKDVNMNVAVWIRKGGYDDPTTTHTFMLNTGNHDVFQYKDVGKNVLLLNSRQYI